MANYKGVDAHLYQYGVPGTVECLCGSAVLICNGGHHNCARFPAFRQSLAGYPVCKFCGEPIAKKSQHFVTNSHTKITLWEEVACSPFCDGYAFDGFNPLVIGKFLPPTPVIAAPSEEKIEKKIEKPKRIFSPEELEYRRVLITERIKQMLAIVSRLGHNGNLPQIDVYETEPLKLACDYCGGTVEMSRSIHPSIAFKGEIVQFVCKSQK